MYPFKITIKNLIIITIIIAILTIIIFQLKSFISVYAAILHSKAIRDLNLFIFIHLILILLMITINSLILEFINSSNKDSTKEKDLVLLQDELFSFLNHFIVFDYVITSMYLIDLIFRLYY